MISFNSIVDLLRIISTFLILLFLATFNSIVDLQYMGYSPDAFSEVSFNSIVDLLGMLSRAIAMSDYLSIL